MRTFGNIVRDKSKNRLDPEQIDRLEKLDIRFSTNTKDYLNSGKKRFNEKAFTPISKKPKNTIDKDNRAIFYNIVDHYPNSIKEMEKVHNKKPIEVYVEGRDVVPKRDKHGLYTDGLYSWNNKGNFAMINVMHRPTVSGHTLFHEMRHAQQNRGMTPVVLRKPTIEDRNKEYERWKNLPEEKDAEQYAHSQLRIGERQAKPPFKDTHNGLLYTDKGIIELKPERDKKSKNDNQIYLDPKKVPLSKKQLLTVGLTPTGRIVIDTMVDMHSGGAAAYVMNPPFKDKTFLGNAMHRVDFTQPQHIRALSNILGHEEMHTILRKTQGGTASTQLDNITIPVVGEKDEGQIINPYSASTIQIGAHKITNLEAPEIPAYEQQALAEDTRRLKDEWKEMNRDVTSENYHKDWVNHHLTDQRRSELVNEMLGIDNTSQNKTWEMGKPLTAYHGTRGENIASIRAKGLLPGDKLNKEGSSAVYVTTDPDIAGDFTNRKAPGMLKLNLPAKDVKKAIVERDTEYNRYRPTAMPQVLLLDSVHPSNIEVLNPKETNRLIGRERKKVEERDPGYRADVDYYTTKGLEALDNDTSSRNEVFDMPIDTLWEMRKKGSYIGNMEPKRTDTTMNAIKEQMQQGNIEPIVMTVKDFKTGVLQDGKHRLIVAKELGMQTYPLDIIKKDTHGRDMVWAKGLDAEDVPLAKGTFGEKTEPAYTKKRVLMDPNIFLQRQYDQRPNAKTSKMTFEQWSDVGEYGKQRIEGMKKALIDPNAQVPVPIEEYARTGERKDFQEGRHRGIAAQELGMQVPVILARKRAAPWDRTGDKTDIYKHRYDTTSIPSNTDWDKSIAQFPEEDEQSHNRQLKWYNPNVGERKKIYGRQRSEDKRTDDEKEIGRINELIRDNTAKDRANSLRYNPEKGIMEIDNNEEKILEDHSAKNMALYSVKANGEPYLHPEGKVIDKRRGVVLREGVGHGMFTEDKERMPLITELRFRTEPEERKATFGTLPKKRIALSGVSTEEEFNTEILSKKQRYEPWKKAILFAQEKENLPNDTGIYTWQQHSYNFYPMMKIEDIKNQEEK